MKQIAILLLAALALVCAQQFAEHTTYYQNDSQCKLENLVGAIARVVNETSCVEQPCNLIPNTQFYRQVSCRQSELVVPILNWPTYYIYNEGQCPKGSLSDFFYSRPGTCFPISFRGVPVYLTASCYPWGVGATICADGCGGVQCQVVNGTDQCTQFNFGFASAWILGQCAAGPVAPAVPAAPVAAPVVVTPPVAQPVAIPAVLINNSAAIAFCWAMLILMLVSLLV